MYIATADIETYLGKTLSTTEEAKYNALIVYTKAFLDSLIGDLSSSDKTFYIEYEEAYVKAWVVEFEVPTVNVTELKEINSDTYTWTLRVVWPYANRLQITDIEDYTFDDDYPQFEVVVTSGYSTIPEDLKYAQLLMVMMEASKSSWRNIKSYTLWPRSFSYADDQEEMANTIRTILSPYMLTIM